MQGFISCFVLKNHVFFIQVSLLSTLGKIFLFLNIFRLRKYERCVEGILRILWEILVVSGFGKHLDENVLVLANFTSYEASLHFYCILLAMLIKYIIR